MWRSVLQLTCRMNWDCRSALEVVVKPARGQGGVRERFLEQLLSGCCEECVMTSLHPHTSLSVVLQILTDQGSVSRQQTSSAV